MKQLLLTASIAALLVPLHAQPTPETGTLLEWQNADAPVALVEELLAYHARAHGHVEYAALEA